MKQPIAGVSPPELGEVTMMTVYPTISSTALGRWLGRLYAIRAGVGPLTVGNFIALASIPVALVLFFYLLLPGVCRRYTLTNRRLVVRKGWPGIDEKWVQLDGFDNVEIKVLPGQGWFHAGEMIFKKGTVETFRISGVSRPEPFRMTCLKARDAYVGVAEVLSRQRELAGV